MRPLTWLLAIVLLSGCGSATIQSQSYNLEPFPHQEPTSTTPQYTIPTADEIEALADEIDEQDMIEDVDLSAANDETSLMLYGRLLGMEANANIVPGQLLVIPSATVVRADLVSQLLEAGFLLDPDEILKHRSSSILVLVPYHEEEAWIDLLTTWAEIDAADTNGLNQLL